MLTELHPGRILLKTRKARVLIWNDALI